MRQRLASSPVLPVGISEVRRHHCFRIRLLIFIFDKSHRDDSDDSELSFSYAANALSISSPFTVFSFIYLQESKVIYGKQEAA